MVGVSSIRLISILLHAGASPLNSNVSLSSQLSLYFSRGLIFTRSFSLMMGLRLLMVKENSFSSPFWVEMLYNFLLASLLHLLHSH